MRGWAATLANRAAALPDTKAMAEEIYLSTLTRMPDPAEVAEVTSTLAARPPAKKAEVLGVFYNKATFQKLGLKLPTTFDEFQATPAAAKAGAVEPNVVGGLDGWPLGHVFMMLQALYEPPQQTTNWTFAVAGSTFDDPGTQQAAGVMQDWARKGYFFKGFGGVGQDAAEARFVKGTGLYFLTGP